MKKFLFSLFFAVSASAQPLWYLHLQSDSSSTYIGFGSSESEESAKQSALNDVASQISVNIDSSVSSSIKDENGQVNSVHENKSSQNTKASLSDYKLIKSELQDGKYYVAVAYENIPSIDKFAKKVQNSYQNLSDENQSTYIKNSAIAKELQKTLAKNIDFSLARKDKKWFIKYKDILQVLDSNDLGKFFTTIANPDLEINTNKKNNILYDGDKFYFKVKSAQSGFVSIVSVYEDGTVSTLMRNVPISANKLQNIPDKEFETIPEAGLQKNGEQTYDLHVAIFSPNKLTFDAFATADEKLISDEKYKNFDELIGFLDNKTFATLKVVTKPK